MSKSMVGYCIRCGENTEHKVISCKDSTGYRIFETVVTVGFALALPRNYQCKCMECGKINTLSR